MVTLRKNRFSQNVVAFAVAFFLVTRTRIPSIEPRPPYPSRSTQKKNLVDPIAGFSSSRSRFAYPSTRFFILKERERESKSGLARFFQPKRNARFGTFGMYPPHLFSLARNHFFLSFLGSCTLYKTSFPYIEVCSAFDTHILKMMRPSSFLRGIHCASCQFRVPASGIS